jgi:uncharacterized membrane protein
MFDWIGIACHQLPGRSLHCDGEIYPLCYRCAGTALGLFSGYAALAFGRCGWRRRLPDLQVALFLCAAMLPLIVDGWANTLGVWSTPGWIRSLTGAAVGVGLPFLVVPLLQPVDLEATRDLPPTLRSGRSLLLPLEFATGWVTLLNFAGSMALLRASEILSALGEAAFGVTLILVVWRMLAERLHRVAGRSETPVSLVP